MEFWDHIVHTALLGTDKRQLKQEELPGDLGEVFLSVDNKIDKEDQYLAIASVGFNYRKCGLVPFHKNVIRSHAAEEVRPYCSRPANQLLNEVIAMESLQLLGLWLHECASRDQVVLPEFIPVLLDLSIRYKPIQEQVLSVIGKRGEWLLPFNEAWQFNKVIIDENIWQTGTLDQRKLYLQQLRKTDPNTARESLKQEWPQENANTKTELLKQLSINVSDADIEWLQQLLLEKSQKVKDEAVKLLKLLPASSIVQQYWEVIKQSINIQQVKGLLGFGTKTVLEISLLQGISETIFKSGIEKLSTEKNASDNDFILYQLISAVPPSFFENHYQLTKDALIDVFSKSKTGKQFLTAFGQASIMFRDVGWLRAIIAVTENQFYAGALDLLSDQEAEQYALAFLDKDDTALAVIEYLSSHQKNKWSMNLARAFFKYTVRNPYSFNRSFYNQLILSIPEGIIAELSSYAPAEEYAKSVWSKTSEYIVRLIGLRTRIIKVFEV